VVRLLRGHKGIAESVRRRALELAARVPDVPDRFHQASAHLVRYPDLSTGLYEQALDWAQTACRLAPGTPDYLTTRGIAQYRLGRYADALRTLQQSAKLRQTAQPANLAFLAMAHHRLGHSPEARAALKRLREVMKASFAGPGEEALAFRAEAEDLAGAANPAPTR
jgi:tetratricopeptide (TPR) repeat protein